MTDTPDPRGQMARPICSGCDQPTHGCWCRVVEVIESELALARSGEGYEERPVAEEIVEKLVAPLLAAKDRQYEQAVADWAANDAQVLADAQRQADRADALSALLRGMARKVAHWRRLARLRGKALAVTRRVLNEANIRAEQLRAEVERLRAELAAVDAWAQARSARERAADRAAWPSSGLAGLAAPDTTEEWGKRATPLTTWCGDHTSHGEHEWINGALRVGCPGRLPRRDERVNPRGLYAEPTDPGGA